ncbi:unnamed protein product [Calypogeia fissa]
MTKKGRRKKKDQHDSKDGKNIEELKKQVTGANAPKAFVMKKKEKSESFQATFDKQAMDALASMLKEVSDPPPSTYNAPTKKGNSSKRGKGATNTTKQGYKLPIKGRKKGQATYSMVNKAPSWYW